MCVCFYFASQCKDQIFSHRVLTVDRLNDDHDRNHKNVLTNIEHAFQRLYNHLFNVYYNDDNLKQEKKLINKDSMNFFVSNFLFFFWRIFFYYGISNQIPKRCEHTIEVATSIRLPIYEQLQFKIQSKRNNSNWSLNNNDGW